MGLLLLALALAAGGLLSNSAEPSAAQPRDPQQADAAQKTTRELNIRYAKVYLELAQVELQKTSDANKVVPNTFPDIVVQRLRENVRIAEEKVQQAARDDASRSLQVELRHAEAKLKVAELDLAKALEVNRQRPRTISPLEVQRLRLSVEVAQLGLARWRDPANVAQLPDRVQWQLELIREEIIELNNRLDKISNRSYRRAT